MGRESR